MIEYADIERIKKAIDWLVYDKVVKNRRELAEKIGYTESSLSQILNGKVAVSDKFIKKLLDFENRLNPDWFLADDPRMLKENENPLSQITNQTLENLSTEAFLKALMKMYDEGKIFPAAVLDRIVNEKNEEIARQSKTIEELQKEIWQLKEEKIK